MSDYNLNFYMYEGEEGYQKPSLKASMTVKAIDEDNADILGRAICNHMEGNWFVIVE